MRIVEDGFGMRGIGIAVIALAMVAFALGTAYAVPVPGGSLDPSLVPKYQAQLVKPPVMPIADAPGQPGKGKGVWQKKTNFPVMGGDNTDYYEIAMRQFQQQILPSATTTGAALPQTTVWSYGPAHEYTGDNLGKHVTQGGHYFYPAFTIEAKWEKPVRVKWVNELRHINGKYRPHLLPVDQTLHWCNPNGTTPDSRGTDPTRYTGPVPIVTHLHGAHVQDYSDGYPEAWWLPDANDIPAGYHKVGSFYNFYKTKFSDAWGVEWAPGSATFQYPNDQRAATLWYHDHGLGITRLNVYAGPAGFYLLRGGLADMVTDSATGMPAVLPGPAPDTTVDPFGDYYEIPIAIQGRSFNTDGSLFFPDNRAFFEVLNVPGQPEQFPGAGYLDIPYIPDPACGGPSDISPIWNPEFFGNMMVVNGQTWPVLNVEPRRYRFRFLNGCNARFLILKLATDNTPIDNSIDDGLVTPVAGAFWQIGADGGFLPAVQNLDQLLIGPAERNDVIVDFTNYNAGDVLYLINVGPDEPYNGEAFDAADPGSTGQVMKFVVGPLKGADTSTPPGQLVLPARPTLTPTVTRKVSLNEEGSATVLVADDGKTPPGLKLDCTNGEPFGPRAALLGSIDSNGNNLALKWMDDITENPTPGATETWEIYNFTGDAHPIHLHLVQFQVVGRELIGGGPSVAGSNAPLPGETGEKDTVIAYPGEVTRVKAKFDMEGLYVWHCHIIDHEDNEMMRPYFIGDPTGYPKISVTPVP